MRLTELAAEAGLSVDPGLADPEISSVGYDSRSVSPGELFCCLRGSVADGHEFAAAAAAAGAVALLVDHPVEVAVPQLVVRDTRESMGLLASAHEGHPSRKLAIVAVTGTNGKTTTTHMVASICRTAGRPAETIGTLSGPRTTPESPDLQRILAGFVAGGADVVAMEVSSHALDQGRVTGAHFAVAGFTNLSPDHLDYHVDMEEYFAAKARLFTPALTDAAVIHVGSPWGRRMASTSTVPTTTVSDEDEAVDLEVNASGSRFVWRGHEVVLPIIGRFNVSNAVVAAALCAEIGIDESLIAAGLSSLEQVPGRFELVEVGQPFRVVVDYAHTPDGLEQLLRSARELATGGRVVVVFGCGGDRDRAKRPMMGAVAARLADQVIVTSDNPRNEEPAAIIAEVVAGIGSSDHLVEPDRARAIAIGLSGATEHDVVVIAGKGHERTQAIGDTVVEFDDVDVARTALAERWGAEER